MSDQEIIEFIRKRLNEEGRAWGLEFQVHDNLQPDGGWTKAFIQSNATKRNSAAERQIISDVEEEITESSGREFLLVPVAEFNVA